MRPLDPRPVPDAIDHNSLLKGTVCWYVEGCTFFLEMHPDPDGPFLGYPTVRQYYSFSSEMLVVRSVHDPRPIFTGFLRKVRRVNLPLFHAQRRWVPGR